VPYLETVEDDPKTLVVEAFDADSILIGHRTVTFTVVDTAGLDGDVFTDEFVEERGSLFPMFDVLIDVFSDENTDVVSLTGENFRSYYANESISEGNNHKCLFGGLSFLFLDGSYSLSFPFLNNYSASNL